MTIRITKRERPGRGLQRIALEQIDAVIAQIEDSRLEPDIKVHDCRKCCKFLRALLLLNRQAMGADWKTEDERFRDIARLLSSLRDIHVQATILAEFKGQPAPRAPEGEAGLREALSCMRTARLSVQAWPLTARDVGDILPGFSHTYAKCRQARKRASKAPSDHRFHRYRKWAKYHRYQVNMLELVNRVEMRKRGQALELLGDVLGNAHDLAELQGKLENAERTDPQILDSVAKRKQLLYRQALSLGRKHLGRRPATVAAELARWWSIWRA